MEYYRMRASLCRSSFWPILLTKKIYHNIISQAVENGIQANKQFIDIKTFSDNMEPLTLIASEFWFYSKDPNVQRWEEFDTISISKRGKKKINLDIESVCT